MIKLLTIIGARPQIIKAAAISRAIRCTYSDFIEESILHTGQHYDLNMSEIFFEELDIPKPDFNLNVGSGSHGEQTANMIKGIEKVLISDSFDGVLVYGDTNSTLAGAIAASKLNIPIFHVEAGLRSYNMSMPEEINRIVCDQLSSILFAPTQLAFENLKKEGYDVSDAVFTRDKQREIYVSGDVMYDNSTYYAEVAEKTSHIIQDYGLENDEFVLATIHRNNNTDSKERLSEIFRALLQIAEDCSIKVVVPLHPRTSHLLEDNISKDLYNRIYGSKELLILPPVSFLDMICLEKNAKVVMTDSGGVQKEAFFFEKPCIILRPETEWVEIIEHKAGIIADADSKRILDAYKHLKDCKVHFPKLFGDAKAAQYIIDKIINYIS